MKILDTTLRDGSYAVNFSFTSEFTGLMCKKLENAGFEYIEIGHGTGFNASNRGYGKAIQTDEEYMIAAENNLKKAKYGMFCIPGIARLEDIDLASKHNIGFIRIGTDVTRVEESKQFIKKAKDYGITVAANYMKSYAVSPEKFSKLVQISEKFGADIVYIVDSAGGMFPEDIKKYYNSIRKISDIQIGFHGHDNLGLSISNSLAAIDIGIEFVDSSLQGLGRSSGNACTEILLLALKKKGFQIPIDYQKILDLGYDDIHKFVPEKGKSPLDIISGFANFHSSYMPDILAVSEKFKINPIELIIEYTKIDQINMNKKNLEIIAFQLKTDDNMITKYKNYQYIGNEQNEER